MKHKVFLPLLEQLCMIGFFALAAALCVKGFALAHRISDERCVKDRAVIAAQNTAETLKSTNGNLSAAAELLSGVADDTSLTIGFDADGQPTVQEDNEAFRILAQIVEDDNPFWGSAILRVSDKNGVIYEITVGWQEGSDVTS